MNNGEELMRDEDIIIKEIESIRKATAEIFNLDALGGSIIDMYSNHGSYLFCRILQSLLLMRNITSDVLVGLDRGKVYRCVLRVYNKKYGVTGEDTSGMYYFKITNRLLEEINSIFTVAKYLDEILNFWKKYEDNTIPIEKYRDIDKMLHIYLFWKLA